MTELSAELLATAREELLFRIRYRDAWLKLNLLAQATIWGLAKGVQITGMSRINPFPEALVLAFPVSFVLAGLYYVEDRLIHYLSKYIASRWPYSWDASPELAEYAKGVTLPLRVAAQVACFLVLPGYLTYLQFGADWSRFAFQAVLALLILSLIVFGYVQRRGTGG